MSGSGGQFVSEEMEASVLADEQVRMLGKVKPVGLRAHWPLVVSPRVALCDCWSVPALPLTSGASRGGVAVGSQSLALLAQIEARAIEAASALFCSSRRSSHTEPMSTVSESIPIMTPPPMRTAKRVATAPRSRSRRLRSGRPTIRRTSSPPLR